MNIEVLYFIKYFQEGFERYLERLTDCDATFCFDLEDSIQDIFDQKNTPSLKANYRKILDGILNNKSIPIKRPVAIRINSVTSGEFSRDINFLRNISSEIHTILIPKIEFPEEISFVFDELKKNSIECKNIGVFIETERGLNNLTSIISVNEQKFDKIIFGHADYNFDLKKFPFVHQDDPEYWSWVKVILLQLKDSRFTFINSPCFYLRSDSFFESILNYLSTISNGFGQLTLTSKQTRICNAFVPGNNLPFCRQSDQVDIYEYSSSIISSAGKNNHKKGLTITENNILITPQEYKMAAEFLKHNKLYAGI